MQPTKLLLCLNLIGWSLSLAYAQDPASQKQLYSISGTLVNAVSGEPLKGATVTAIGGPMSQPSGAKPQPQPQQQAQEGPKAYTATSGPAGEFEVQRVPAGVFVVAVQKAGFHAVDARGGNSLTGIKPVFIQNSSVQHLHIKLQPLGVIRGRVLDEDGEPIARARVVAFRRSIFQGVERYEEVRNVRTDDLGEYRLWNLEPGQYRLRAESKAVATSYTVANDLPADRTLETFTPVYAGGSAEFHGAQVVDVPFGYEGKIDFKVRLERSGVISGTLTSLPMEGSAPTFHMLRGEEALATLPVMYSSNSGKFQVSSVPAGSYTLRIQTNSRVADIPVRVGRGAVLSLPGTIELQEMPNLSVNVRVVSNPQQQQQQQKTPQQGPTPAGPARCHATLVPVGTSALSVRRVYSTDFEAKAGEAAPIRQVYPGTYRIAAECTGSYVSAIRIQGDSELLTVRTGVEPGPVEFTVSPGGGTVSFHLAGMRPPGDFLKSPEFVMHQAVLVPMKGPGDPGLRAIVCAFGGGLVQNVKPGEYTAYLLEEFDRFPYRDPKVLEQLRGGVSFRVEESEVKDIEFKAVAK